MGIYIYVRENLKLEDYFQSLFFFLVLTEKTEYTNGNSENEEANLHIIGCCGNENTLKHECCTYCTAQSSNNNEHMLEENDDVQNIWHNWDMPEE